MAIGYLTIASAQSVTSAYTIPAPCRGIGIGVCTSLTSTELRIEFAQTTTGPFYELKRRDGTGFPHAVFSGAVGNFWVTVEFPPTSIFRLSAVQSQAAVNTFTIAPLRFT